MATLQRVSSVKKKSSSGNGKDALLEGSSGAGPKKMLMMRTKGSFKDPKTMVKSPKEKDVGDLQLGGQDPSSQPNAAQAMMQNAAQAAVAARARQARKSMTGATEMSASTPNVGSAAAGRGSSTGSSTDVLHGDAGNSGKKLPDGDAIRSSVPCDKCSAATPWKLKMPCGRRVPLCPPCTSAFLAVYQEHVTNSKAMLNKPAPPPPKQAMQSLSGLQHTSPQLPPDSQVISTNMASSPRRTVPDSSRGRNGVSPVQKSDPLRGPLVDDMNDMARRVSSKALNRIPMSMKGFGPMDNSKGRFTLPVV